MDELQSYRYHGSREVLTVRLQKCSSFQQQLSGARGAHTVRVSRFVNNSPPVRRADEGGRKRKRQHPQEQGKVNQLKSALTLKNSTKPVVLRITWKIHVVHFRFHSHVLLLCLLPNLLPAGCCQPSVRTSTEGSAGVSP